MLALLIAGTFGIAHGAGTCPAPKADKLTYNTLSEAIQNPACNIRSVADALRFLPEDAKNSYALFYRSRSIQGPFKNDFKNPRAILHVNDNLMISFNNDPKHPGSRSLEIVEINSKGGKDDAEVFKYREISFPFDDKASTGKSWAEVRKGMHFSDANPKKCAACHGRPARPIFPGYPDWDGSFGSQHSEYPAPKQDIDGLREYSAELESDRTSRYQLLPEVEDLTSDPEKAYRHFDGSNDRINQRLGEANAVRVAREIRRTPDYKKYRYAILAGLLRCEDYPSFFPHSVRDGLLKNMDARFDLTAKWPPDKENQFIRDMYGEKRLFILSDLIVKSVTAPPPGNTSGPPAEVRYSYPEYLDRVNKHLGEPSLFRKLQLDTIKLQGVPRGDPLGSNLRMVMEGRGIKIDSWFLDLTQPTYRYHNGGAAAEVTMRELDKIDPDLDKELVKQMGPQGSRSYMDQEKVCARLKKLSRKSLAKTKVAALKPEATAESSTEAGACCGQASPHGGAHAGYPETFLNTCTQCHADDEYDMAPPIPFSTPRKMAMWLATGNNMSKIKSKLLAPDEDGRMPPTRRLTDDELSKIIEYLSGPKN